MKENNSSISVIISTHNRCESLKSTLNSLLCQEDNEKSKFNYEVIIVDNNSSDNTKEIVYSYEQKFAGRLKYVFEPKQGLSYGRNRGILVSRGDILAFTDDDVVVMKNWLNNIAKVFEETDADAVCGKILPTWASQPKDWLYELWQHKNNTLGVLALFDLGSKLLKIEQSRIGFFGANMVFKRNVFDLCGGFAEVPRATDSEFFSRVFAKGLNLYYSPEISVYHLIPQHRMTRNYFIKWSFRSGIVLSLLCKRYNYFSTPNQFREFIDKSFSCLFCSLKGKRVVAFSHFLSMVKGLGFFIGALRN